MNKYEQIYCASATNTICPAIQLQLTQGQQSPRTATYVMGSFTQRRVGLHQPAALRHFSQSYVNFTSLLPSYYFKIKGNSHEPVITIKGEKIFFTFNTEDFIYEDFFIQNIKDRLLYDRSYYVLIRIRYDKDLYKMAGKQFVFIHIKDVEKSLSDLYSQIVDRVNKLLVEYKIHTNSLIYIQTIFAPFDKRILSDLKLDHIFNFKTQPISFKKDVLYFPLSNNPKLLGLELYVEYYDDHIILIKGSLNPFNIVKVVIYADPDSIIFNRNIKFYYRDVVNPNYILAILEDKEHNTYIKQAYDLKGYLLDKVEDRVSESELAPTVRVGNKDTTFINKNHQIILKKRPICFKPLKKIELNKNNIQVIEDQKIGVFDLEVYKNIQLDKEFVYGAGLYTTYSTKKPIIFYIDKDLNSSKVIINLIEEMFKDRHSGIT